MSLICQPTSEDIKHHFINLSPLLLLPEMFCCLFVLRSSSVLTIPAHCTLDHCLFQETIAPAAAPGGRRTAASRRVSPSSHSYLYQSLPSVPAAGIQNLALVRTRFCVHLALLACGQRRVGVIKTELFAFVCHAPSPSGFSLHTGAGSRRVTRLKARLGRPGCVQKS